MYKALITELAYSKHPVKLSYYWASVVTTVALDRSEGRGCSDQQKAPEKLSYLQTPPGQFSTGDNLLFVKSSHFHILSFNPCDVRKSSSLPFSGLQCIVSASAGNTTANNRSVRWVSFLSLGYSFSESLS